MGQRSGQLVTPILDELSVDPTAKCCFQKIDYKMSLYVLNVINANITCTVFTFLSDKEQRLDVHMNCDL